METAALVYPAKGRVDGSGTLILAGSGLQRVGPSVCAGCGFRAGSGVAASLCRRPEGGGGALESPAKSSEVKGR